SAALPPPPRPTLFPYTTLFRSVLDRAAAARAGAIGPRVAAQRQVHTGDVVPRVDRARSCDGRVDTAGHRSDDPHEPLRTRAARLDRKSTRLNSSHVKISYAVFC